MLTQHVKLAPTWLLHGYCQKSTCLGRHKSAIPQGDADSNLMDFSRSVSQILAKVENIFWEYHYRCWSKKKIIVSCGHERKK